MPHMAPGGGKGEEGSLVARNRQAQMVVATAAPVTPISGNGPRPKIKHGSRTMLQPFAIHRERRATVASPAPRNAAFNRNRKMMLKLPPSSTAVNPAPCSMTPSDAPMSTSRSRANMTPKMPTPTDMSTPIQIDCPVTSAAPWGSDAPMRRDTIAVMPMPSPMAAA